MAVIEPTGRVVRDPIGLELIIERRIVTETDGWWEWIITPPRLKKWLGEWRGGTGAGATGTVRFADQADAEPVSIVDCAADRLVADLGRGGAARRTTLSLAQTAEATTVFLRQRVSNPPEAGEAGPRWEYRLDRLLAARTGAPLPELADYATQRPYYERIALETESQWGHSLGA